MNDRELLELAAKAAGYEVEEDGMGNYAFEDECPWEPLTDDGDALRLAVKLKMVVDIVDTIVVVSFGRMKEGYLLQDDVLEKYDTDPYAATRRAIVRAAAEIGRQQ